MSSFCSMEVPVPVPVDKLWPQNSRPSQTHGGGGGGGREGGREGGGITLILEPVNDTFQQKRVTLDENGSIKIGRTTNKGTIPTDSNGYFDSKVLSRNHAEVSYRNNQVFIKDLRSSNGTFINGKRLSAEGKESSLVELRHGDDLEFGVDIVNEQDKKLMFRKVAAKVFILQAGSSGNEIYDVGIINGIEKAITNGHIKRRMNKVLQIPSNTDNSLMAMLEAELENARADSRYLSEIGCMLNDATNTLDLRNKRANFSDRATDHRFHEESHSEAQIKLREAEIKLNEAISAQKEYKEKFIASDQKIMELKERYIASEKKASEWEQKCITSEKKADELERKCLLSNYKAVNFEEKYKDSNKKAVELENKCKALEDALQGTGHVQTKTDEFKDLEERLVKITNELSSTQYFLEDTREQLKRTEKDLHASQKKCREYQSYATKYSEAMKTIEELHSVGESIGNRENRDKAIEKFDEERLALLNNIQCLEEAVRKNNAESSLLVEKLRKVESLNKNLKEEVDKERELSENLQLEFDIRVEEELRQLNCSHDGSWRRHKKQGSEPIKECEMTNEDNINIDDKKFDSFNQSLLVKGSVGVVVFGIGIWCLSRLYP